MQFTHGIGIVITKAELKAITSFARDADDAKIAFRVRNGKLLAWTACPLASVYHHGDAFSGDGKPAVEDNNWGVLADTLRGIEKMMDKDDELILRVNRLEKMTQADIRVIDTSDARMSISLDGHVSGQIGLDMPHVIPERPFRDSGEIPTSELVFSWGVLQLLKEVTKAAETNAARFFVSSNPASPVYVEVDKIKNLAGDADPSWVCVLLTIALDERRPGGVDDVVREMRDALDRSGATIEAISVSVTGDESDPIASELASRKPKASKKSKGSKKSKATEPEEESDAPSLEDFEEDEAS